MTKKTNFIDFLNTEFSSKVEEATSIIRKDNVQNLQKNKTTAKVVKVGKVSKIEKSAKKENGVFGGKSNLDAKNRLTKASKLIKTMEVFLNDEKTDMTIDDMVIKEWAYVYDDMRLNIARDIEDLLRTKKRSVKKKSYYALIEEKLEYASRGNVLNYSVAIISMLVLSFFSTAVFPELTNKSVAILDSFFTRPISSITQIKSIPADKSFVEIKQQSVSVSREQLAEYIKKNSDKIKNDINVKVEDIIGRVAGVEE